MMVMFTTVHYFKGIAEFKTLLKSLDNEIKQLVGDTRIMLALKKGSSIGNRVVRNKQLSFSNTVDSQPWGAPNLASAVVAYNVSR